MIVKYHKRFEKQFKRLSEKDRLKVIKTIELFVENPLDPALKNHSLKGSLAGMRSLSVSPDLRIVFEESDGYALVIFLDLGNHSRVYG